PGRVHLCRRRANACRGPAHGDTTTIGPTAELRAEFRRRGPVPCLSQAVGYARDHPVRPARGTRSLPSRDEGVRSPPPAAVAVATGRGPLTGAGPRSGPGRYISG